MTAVNYDSWCNAVVFCYRTWNVFIYRNCVFGWGWQDWKCTWYSSTSWCRWRRRPTGNNEVLYSDVQASRVMEFCHLNMYWVFWKWLTLLEGILQNDLCLKRNYPFSALDQQERLEFENLFAVSPCSNELGLDQYSIRFERRYKLLIDSALVLFLYSIIFFNENNWSIFSFFCKCVTLGNAQAAGRNRCQRTGT